MIIKRYLQFINEDVHNSLGELILSLSDDEYVRNIISNVSRLLFGIPNSYFYQREQTIWRIIPNSIILTFFIFSLIITLANRRFIPSEIYLVVGITMFYLLFSSLVSAYPRQFYVVVPLLLFWFAFIFDKAFKFRLKFIK